jgi:hypothetical protein
MPILVPVAVVLFLAPGYFISRLLHSRARWPSAMIVSLLVLFYGAFLAGICGLPVRFVTVAVWMIVVSVVAAVAFRPTPPASVSKDESPPGLRKLAVGAGTLIGGFLLLSCTLRPLTGYDTVWRWDFLARRVLELERFDFYPAQMHQDFAIYFYPESISPLVSFSYWWLYAAAGQHIAELTALAIVGQYAAILGLTYRSGAVLFSRRAGLLAVIALVTSLLFYRSLAIGQETGLTALSMVGMVYFIASAGSGTDYRAMVLAGLSAALGALAREYGWALVGCGLIAGYWRQRGWREMLVFGLTVCVVAGPWYLRTLLLTGNPLYSNRLLGLPVNPVLAGIMDFLREHLGVGRWSLTQWGAVGWYVLSYAPLQIVLGVPAGLLFARRHGYLAIAAVVVTCLFLSSVGYTSGGPFYAARVLAPALVLLSLLAGALLDRLRPPAAFAVAAMAVAVLFAGAVLYAAIHPATLHTPPEQWLAAALAREPGAPLQGGRDEEALPRLLAGKLSPGTRLLAENCFAYAALAGTEYQVVPVWSPEVAFLFDKTLDAETIRRLLCERNIRAVVYNPVSLSTHYLQRESPLYADAPHGWKPLLALEGTRTVIYELPAPEREE